MNDSTSKADLPTEFHFKLDPYQHQIDCLKKSCDKEFFALFAEQGTGKTKIILDNAVYLYRKEKINALLVLAPNGAQWNWALNEIPKHLALEHNQHAVHVWLNKKTKKYTAELELLMMDHKTSPWSGPNHRLKIFLLNIEAVSTESGFFWINKFLRNHKTMMVIDESTIIKSPKAKRTKRVMILGAIAKYRRVMTGTPITNGLIDIYCQMRFLSAEIFKHQRNWFAFRARYARLKQIPQPGGRYVTVIAGYKEGAIGEVKRITDPCSFWAVKSECLDLPPKIYKLHYVELSGEQLKVYGEMASLMMAVHDDEYIKADIALTKFLRLQQIIGGFFPVSGSMTKDEVTSGGELQDYEVKKLNPVTPKLKKLMEIVETASGKIIIWAEFSAEIKMIVEALKDAHGHHSVVEYHGGVTDLATRKKALYDFQNSDDTAFYLVAHTRAAGRSHTLHRAEDVIYYSNSYSLEMRLQSEDRVHRLGLKHSVTYHDIEAVKAFANADKQTFDTSSVKTLDHKIIKCLRDKKSIADEFRDMGIEKWI